MNFGLIYSIRSFTTSPHIVFILPKGFLLIGSFFSTINSSRFLFLRACDPPIACRLPFYILFSLNVICNSHIFFIYTVKLSITFFYQLMTIYLYIYTILIDSQQCQNPIHNTKIYCFCLRGSRNSKYKLL